MFLVFEVANGPAQGLFGAVFAVFRLLLAVRACYVRL